MEKLPSDVKIELLMKLPFHEILQVCQTSKTMSKICFDARYDPLWRNKIKEDFSTDYRGENAFEKYKFFTKLYQTDLYIVFMIDDYEANSSGIFGIYDSNEKAEEAIINEHLEEFSYSQLKYAFFSPRRRRNSPSCSTSVS